MRNYLLLFTFGLLSSVAIADEKEADDCLRNKIWSGYDDGWAVRTATTTSLAQDDHRVYLVTLYAGNEYKFEVCDLIKDLNDSYQTIVRKKSAA